MKTPHEANSQQHTQCSSLHHLHVAHVWAYTLTRCHRCRPLWLTNYCGMKRSPCVKTLRPLQQVKTAQTVWLLSVSWQMIYQRSINFNRQVAKKQSHMLSGIEYRWTVSANWCVHPLHLHVSLQFELWTLNPVQYYYNIFFTRNSARVDVKVPH